MANAAAVLPSRRMKRLMLATLAILSLAACSPSTTSSPSAVVSPSPSAAAVVTFAPSNPGTVIGGNAPSEPPDTSPPKPPAPFHGSYDGHGTWTVAVEMPAGTYAVKWSAEGVDPTGAGGCSFSVAFTTGAKDVQAVKATVAPRASKDGTNSIELAAARIATISGDGCTWSVDVAPAS